MRSQMSTATKCVKMWSSSRLPQRQGMRLIAGTFVMALWGAYIRSCGRVWVGARMRVAVGWVGGGVQGWLRLCAGTSEMFFEMREYAKGCVCVCV